MKVPRQLVSSLQDLADPKGSVRRSNMQHANGLAIDENERLRSTVPPSMRGYWITGSIIFASLLLTFLLPSVAYPVPIGQGEGEVSHWCALHRSTTHLFHSCEPFMMELERGTRQCYTWRLRPYRPLQCRDGNTSPSGRCTEEHAMRECTPGEADGAFEGWDIPRSRCLHLSLECSDGRQQSCFGDSRYGSNNRTFWDGIKCKFSDGEVTRSCW